mmetsp:Transcript_28553/g.68033  ORF Transcript_28553/g.68033 Transcript_28553/m.68033 type:complete len:256 (+) Transcript_28553:744-1511(+)
MEFQDLEDSTGWTIGGGRASLIGCVPRATAGRGKTRTARSAELVSSCAGYGTTVTGATMTFLRRQMPGRTATRASAITWESAPRRARAARTSPRAPGTTASRRTRSTSGTVVTARASTKPPTRPARTRATARTRMGGRTEGPATCTPCALQGSSTTPATARVAPAGTARAGRSTLMPTRTRRSRQTACAREVTWWRCGLATTRSCSSSFATLWTGTGKPPQAPPFFSAFPTAFPRRLGTCPTVACSARVITRTGL